MDFSERTKKAQAQFGLGLKDTIMLELRGREARDPHDALSWATTTLSELKRCLTEHKIAQQRQQHLARKWVEGREQGRTGKERKGNDGRH